MLKKQPLAKISQNIRRFAAGSYQVFRAEGTERKVGLSQKERQNLDKSFIFWITREERETYTGVRNADCVVPMPKAKATFFAGIDLTNCFFTDEKTAFRLSQEVQQKLLSSHFVGL